MITVFKYTIPPEFHQSSIQSFLKRNGFSDSLIKSLKAHSDSILLNNRPERMTSRLSYGDNLTVNLTEPDSTVPPVNLPLDILYEDSFIVAVNKPRNMPTHPSYEHTHDTLSNALMYHFGPHFTLHPITRLDKDTSGVVLFAKNALYAHLFSKAIRENQIQKDYVAILSSPPPALSGCIDAPIIKLDSLRRGVSPLGKSAITNYRVLKTHNNLTLVALSPVTGRTHQLRVHMAHLASPILGDFLYNPSFSTGGLKLHCEKISFTYPLTSQKLTITAPIPADMDLFE